MNGLLVEKKLKELSVKAVEIYPSELKISDIEFEKLENKIDETYDKLRKNSPNDCKIFMELEELESIRANKLAEFFYQKGLKDGLEIIKIISNF